MLSCFNLDQSKILWSGNELNKRYLNFASNICHLQMYQLSMKFLFDKEDNTVTKQRNYW